jgi:hypothetical protein
VGAAFAVSCSSPLRQRTPVRPVSSGTAGAQSEDALSASAAADDDEPDARSLEGQTKSCTVHSDKSANDYDIDVEFHGTYATLDFDNGGCKDVDLDDPDTEDLHQLSATDSDGESWEIDISDAP